DAVLGLQVFRASGQGGDVGERDIEVGRANRVTDGFALLDDRRVILRVGAVERVLSLARVIVLTALVEEELREIAIPGVAGLAVEADEADLQALVTGDIRLLAGAVRRVDRVGRLDRRLERACLARRLVVGGGGLEKRALRADGRFGVGPSRVDPGGDALDQIVDALFERGIGTLRQHVAGGLDELRRRPAAALLRPVEDVLDRHGAIGFELARPEFIGDVDLRLRNGTDRVIRSDVGQRRLRDERQAARAQRHRNREKFVPHAHPPCEPRAFYRLPAEYLLGAPGVGRSLATCAPAACARVSGRASVMPVPALDVPAACANVSGAVTAIVAPPLPPAVEATTAVSSFAPLSIVMRWP